MLFYRPLIFQGCNSHLIAFDIPQVPSQQIPIIHGFYEMPASISGQSNADNPSLQCQYDKINKVEDLMPQNCALIVLIEYLIVLYVFFFSDGGVVGRVAGLFGVVRQRVFNCWSEREETANIKHPAQSSSH